MYWFGGLPLLLYIVGIYPWLRSTLVKLADQDDRWKLAPSLLTVAFISLIIMLIGSRAESAWLHWTAIIYLLLAALLCIFPIIISINNLQGSIHARYWLTVLVGLGMTLTLAAGSGMVVWLVRLELM